MNEHGELLLIDKPFGVTSYDVIRFLKREYKESGYPKIKIGHAGTLDPRATGLLLVGVGKMTKKLTELIGKTKVYEAVILLGKQTTTDDLEGEVLHEEDVSRLSDVEISEKLNSLLGEQSIAVPVYSAIKKDGKALYAYARKGQEVSVPTKEMLVREITLDGIERVDTEIYVRVAFDVGSGTYIRSLARELGDRLGVPGTLAELRRISIGDYTLEHARRLSKDEIKNYKKEI